MEQLLKDYNGQTYWLSGNIWSFNKNGNFPKWLNLAIGYGAHNMLTGNGENYSEGVQLPNDRYRQYYLSFDIDLSKINTRSAILKTIFSSLNFIKIPAPTVEFNTSGKPRFYWIYF